MRWSYNFICTIDCFETNLPNLGMLVERSYVCYESEERVNEEHEQEYYWMEEVVAEEEIYPDTEIEVF